MPSWFWGIFAFLLGGVIASFLGVVGERLPRHETLGGTSHCVCGEKLGAGNVPIFGWLFLRGRASCCGAKIPARYVLTEAGLALVWCFIAVVAGLSPLAIAGYTTTALLVLAISWTKPDQELAPVQESKDNKEGSEKPSAEKPSAEKTV